MEEMTTNMAEKLIDEAMPGSEQPDAPGSEILNSLMEVKIPASSTAELDQREGGEMEVELSG